MARPEYVPITGAVLQWAIKDSGLSEAIFAERMNVDASIVRQWIDESVRPTKTEFARMAKRLHRPTAFFFRAEAPQPTQVDANFRSAPGIPARILDVEERASIGTASDLQDVSSWILKALSQPPLGLPRYTLSDPPGAAARAERQRFETSLDDQIQWTSHTAALTAWRDVLESLGVVTLQFDIGPNLAPGFSLWDDRAPVIVMNSRYNITNRIFTLFHEYAHLLQRQDDVIGTQPNPQGAIEIERLERWCESFAAQFLLPRPAFGEFVINRYDYRGAETIASFDQVEWIADRLHVSYQATGRQLVEIGIAPDRLVAHIDRIVRRRLKERSEQESHGPHLTRLQVRSSRYGQRLPRILLSGLSSSLLGRYEVLDYLDLRSSELNVIEGDLGVSRH